MSSVPSTHRPLRFIHLVRPDPDTMSAWQAVAAQLEQIEPGSSGHCLEQWFDDGGYHVLHHRLGVEVIYTQMWPRPDPATRQNRPSGHAVPGHPVRCNCPTCIPFLSRRFAHDAGQRCYCNGCRAMAESDLVTEWLNGGLA